MKVTIDQDGCIQCGACEQSCGEVFVLEGADKASIVKQYQKGSPAVGEVPESLNNCAVNAASSCPVQVITTE